MFLNSKDSSDLLESLIIALGMDVFNRKFSTGHALPVDYDRNL
jgi:hypothetical protein